MNNPLLESTELMAQIEQAIPDYCRIKQLVFEIFKATTGLDASENAKEFYHWLHNCEEIDRIPVPRGGYHTYSHPLFYKRGVIKEFLMFKDIHGKIGTISQSYCQYCTRGPIDKPICHYPINISPISRHNKKFKAFEEEIKNYFRRKGKSEFNDSCKLCVSELFIFGKDETDKDCDNLAKTLNDGLSGSLIEDDIHIDHLNLMKIKTDFKESIIIIHIRKSNLNKHYDVLIENSHYEPNIRTGGRIIL